MPEPVRIAFVISSLDTGGAETMLFKLLERLDRSRFAPTVLCLTTAGAFGPRLEALGVPVQALAMRRGFGNPFKLLELAGRLATFRPALVHTWMYHADLLGGIAARMRGLTPVIWGIRHSDLSWEHNKGSTLAFVKVCARLSKRVPSHILSCSERAREIHIRAGYAASKFTVIPNGFELERFGPSMEARAAVRRELGLPAGAALVGHIGRFHAQKNHAGLIEAARQVHAQRPDAHFLLAGAGVEPSNGAFWSLVEAAGLARHCHALGRRDDIPRLMAALDVLASSSHGEGFPNVLGEAMACEVPCVVTDVGDCAEVVGDAGRVVAAGDMQGLATSLLDVLALPAPERAALGRRARERVAASYEIGDVVRRYERFYQQALAPRAGHGGN